MCGGYPEVCARVGLLMRLLGADKERQREQKQKLEKAAHDTNFQSEAQKYKINQIIMTK